LTAKRGSSNRNENLFLTKFCFSLATPATAGG
jgi:hypothetical protein